MTGNENIYVVETTTGDKWELVGGIYLVKAKDKKAARKVAEEVYPSEKITSIDKIEDVLKSNVAIVAAGRLATLTNPLVE